jgi:DNA-binding XRE family transcriptional regulator
MATKREIQLSTILLKERIERLTGKKVVLKETVKPPLDLQSAGKIAEQIRKILGISQAELAKIAGVSLSTIGRGEKNFEAREKENQLKIIKALYNKAGYEFPKSLPEPESSPESEFSLE